MKNVYLVIGFYFVFRKKLQKSTGRTYFRSKHCDKDLVMVRGGVMLQLHQFTKNLCFAPAVIDNVSEINALYVKLYLLLPFPLFKSTHFCRHPHEISAGLN